MSFEQSIMICVNACENIQYLRIWEMLEEYILG